jgi:NAD-dependent dihydropyrimidine dehydrogenase PreA subunit
MAYVITSLCIREGSCQNVCPVECIVPGKPQDQWPLFYIDPETCVDCGACVRECPVNAIFPVEEVPAVYSARGSETLVAPVGTPGFDLPFELRDNNNQPVHLKATRKLTKGEVVDFIPDIKMNADYFSSGPGYTALQS